MRKVKKKPVLILFLLAGGIALLVSVSYSAYKESKRNQQIQAEVDKLQQEAERIKANNSELQENIAYFETPEFQEKVAKEKLNLQKSDENVVIIKTSPSSITEEDDKNDEPPEEKEVIPNYQKWWNYFFNY